MTERRIDTRVVRSRVAVLASDSSGRGQVRAGGSRHGGETFDLTGPAEPDPAARGRAAGSAGGAGVRVSPIPAVNVATVPQRSPLRYPGGKTWLVPHIRAWLKGIEPAPRLLVEPFAGGGIVSLTAVMEGLVERCLMAELDRDVAAFWHAALRCGPALQERILRFAPTRDAVDALSRKRPHDVLEHGFRTLVLNRTRRGGILAPGASLNRTGENGKGIASRWYPETIIDRLNEIESHAARIGFCETEGMKLLETLLGGSDPGLVVFVDPPYTAGGKRAGKRLYAHNEIDHPGLFGMLADSGADFLMTYDHAPEIVSLVRKHGFEVVQVIMKNTHHARISELIITPRPVFSG